MTCVESFFVTFLEDSKIVEIIFIKINKPVTPKEKEKKTKITTKVFSKLNALAFAKLSQGPAPALLAGLVSLNFT